MNILIVFGSQFGNTEHVARAIGGALEPRHTVRIVAAKEAQTLTADGVDLLIVGAPTQMFGRRLLVRSFLSGLKRHGFTRTPAAAFDTRMGTPTEKNAAAAESFLVAGFTGPLVEGEDERARSWARGVVDGLAVATA